MNYTRISELNDVSILLIRCIREWVKAVFYSQNPMPTLKFLLSIHKAEKTAIPFDKSHASKKDSSVKGMASKSRYKISSYFFANSHNRCIL